MSDWTKSVSSLELLESLKKDIVADIDFSYNKY